jgi:hypothetical protein
MKIAALFQLASIAWAAQVAKGPTHMRLRPTEAGNAKHSVDRDTIPLNRVLYWISNLFPFNILVQDAGDLTAHAEKTLVSILGISATQDSFSDTNAPT